MRKNIFLLSILFVGIFFAFDIHADEVDPIIGSCVFVITDSGNGNICNTTSPNRKCTENRLREQLIDNYCEAMDPLLKNMVVDIIKNNGGLIGWVTSQLSAPVGLTPSAGSIAAVPVVLRWQGTAVEDTVKYEYQISAENTYGDDLESTSQTQSSFSVTQSNTPFRWRVRACPYNNFCSNWAEQTFTTANVSSGGSSGGQTQTSPSGATPILGLPNPLGEGTTFETLLNKIIDFIFWIGMAVAPVMIIVAGFLYVTSAGNPQKVEQAKKIIIYAVVGLVVLLLARGLVKVLESIIGLPSA